MNSEPTIIKGGLAADDRGVVRFVNDFHFEGVKRFYVLENWQPGFVRAWHGHLHETKWVTVTCGAAKIGVAQIIGNGSQLIPYVLTAPKFFILCAQQPAILCIPPGYANGSMALVERTQVSHFSSMTMDETASDDLRWDWDTIPSVWETLQR